MRNEIITENGLKLLLEKRTDGTAICRDAGGIPLTRATAAGIVHTFLREVLKEEDEADISAAKQLKDLYDCHVCVNHIAQVYVKGIMDVPDGKEEIFGNSLPVGASEVLEICGRVFDRSLRRPAAHGTEGRGEIIGISADSLQEFLDRHTSARIIDVRPEYEYNSGHLDKAVNIPLARYVQNPFLAAESITVPLVFCCNSGESARIAAAGAAEAGFTTVGYLGLITGC